MFCYLNQKPKLEPNFVRHSINIRRIIALLVAVFSTALPAYADDDAAIWAAFTNWRLVLYDIPKADGGIPLSDVPWRVVEGQDELDALSHRSALAKGATNEKGEVLLSDQQRQAIFDTWKRVPDKLWLIYGYRALQMTLGHAAGKYHLVLVRPESAWERKERLAKEQAERDRNTPLSPSVYTQAEFDVDPFVRDYSHWQARFEQDVDDMLQIIRRDRQPVQKLAGENATDVLDKLFLRSVHDGEKGRAFKMMLVSDYFQRNQSRTDTPSGAVVTQLMLSPHARPVGFGGAFTDGDSSVELWFMVFDDLSDWSVQDFKDSLVFSAFSPANLPVYENAERDSWPALVFIRDDKGKVMMYGLSQELARVTQSVFRGQTF